MGFHIGIQGLFCRSILIFAMALIVSLFFFFIFSSDNAIKGPRGAPTTVGTRVLQGSYMGSYKN